MTGKLWLGVGLGMLLVAGAVCAETVGMREKRGLSPNGLSPNISPNIIGICQIIDNTPGWPAGEVRIPNSIDPIASVDIYFYQRSHVDLNRAEGTVTILQPPKYGTLKSVDGEVGAYEYLPSSPTHAGKDSATFLVEIGGYKVKVMYVFHVLTSGVGSRPEDIKAICGPKGYWWKISTPSTLTE